MSLRFKYHGNYAGPGYTGGKFTDVGDYSVAPVDRLDQLARQHDYGYEFGSAHAADHELINDTKYGLNKEGLLKLGFQVKDALYNPIMYPAIPRHLKNVRAPTRRRASGVRNAAMQPMQRSSKSTSASPAGLVKAFEKGVRVGSSSNTFAEPAMVSGTSLGRPFQGKSHGRTKDVIEETEYIQDIVSNSTGFSLLYTLPFNPAQISTFPWASSISKQYEKWFCEHVEFIYKPIVSQYASLGQQGKVIMSFDYDASDSPPSTKQQAEDMQEHEDGLPYQYMSLRLKPQLLHERSGKYTRAGALPGGSDIKTFDGGNLYISTSGLASNSGTVGELHVKYRFRLVEPILSASSLSAPVNNQVAQFISASAGETATSASTYTFVFNVPPVTNGIGAVNTSGTITLQPGNYIFMPNVNVSSASGITVAYMLLYNTTAGGPVYPSANFNPEYNIASGGDATQLALSQQWYVSVSGTSTQYNLQFHGANTAGGASITVWGSLLILAV